MANCRNCTYAIFDEVWGEYKCAAYEHTIYDLDSYSVCKLYEKGEPKDSKGGDEIYGNS